MPQGEGRTPLDLDFQILPMSRSDEATPLRRPTPTTPALAITHAGTAGSLGPITGGARSTHNTPPHTGGLFPSAQAVLTFLAVATGARLSSEAVRVRRGPDGLWWAEIMVPWHIAGILVNAAHGQPYTGLAPLWRAVPTDGTPAQAPVSHAPFDGTILLENPDRTLRLAPADWSDATVRDLIHATPLQPVTSEERSIAEAVIITTGTLGRACLRRILGFDCETTVAVVEREPLNDAPPAPQLGTPPANQPLGALLIHLRWRGGYLSPSCLAYLHGLFYLPSTMVARAVDLTESTPRPPHQPDHGRLLVDLRYRSLLAMSLVASLVPAGESWLLSDAEFGQWRLRTVSRPVAGEDFVIPSSP